MVMMFSDNKKSRIQQTNTNLQFLKQCTRNDSTKHNASSKEDEEDTIQNNNSNSSKQLLSSCMLYPNSNCDVMQMSTSSLAYIGDAVFELFIRSRYVWPMKKSSNLQKVVVNKVRAETQSYLYQKIRTNFQFTPEEKSIVSRGRNSAATGKRRSSGPKRFYSVQQRNSNGGGGGPEVYQEATALEALVGYTYLKNPTRCFDILNFVSNELDVMDESE